VRGMHRLTLLIEQWAGQVDHLDDTMHRRAEPYPKLEGIASKKPSHRRRSNVTL
jgi:hypothetical protein